MGKLNSIRIVINSLSREYTETISFMNLDDIDETIKNFSSIKEPLEVKIVSINQLISVDQLSKLKNTFKKIDICSLRIFSNNRETILAGKYLRIDSTFVREKEIKNNLLSMNSEKKNDFLYKGTVRSGDRISSNGNLVIIGDVNPGAIVSAKKNIYVWGKLQGIAFAGNDGNNRASIASLYLNPLQLRIADVVAIGPKDKPKNYYPEIALIDKETIIINPYIIENK